MSKNKILGIDLIKVLSMFGVLFSHTLLAFTKRPDLVHTKLWWLLEPLTVFSAFAVPLFFVTSGYLILVKQTSISQNLKNSLFRMQVLHFEYDFAGLNPYLYCAANFSLVFVTSLLLTWLISKIPKLKMIVGFR